MTTIAGRFKELVKKYGKVGIIVHCSVSAASVSGLYVAIKNNVDVESMLQKIGMTSIKDEQQQQQEEATPTTTTITTTSSSDLPSSANPGGERNKTAELAASSGGALAMALLLNKALFPVRVPITLAITPPLARFLARRNLIKGSSSSL